MVYNQINDKTVSKSHSPSAFTFKEGKINKKIKNHKNWQGLSVKMASLAKVPSAKPDALP